MKARKEAKKMLFMITTKFALQRTVGTLNLSLEDHGIGLESVIHTRKTSWCSVVSRWPDSVVVYLALGVTCSVTSHWHGFIPASLRRRCGFTIVWSLPSESESRWWFHLQVES